MDSVVEIVGKTFTSFFARILRYEWNCKFMIEIIIWASIFVLSVHISYRKFSL